MFKEFYADMKEYEIKNKWMKFEFYFRQPFSLLVLLASLAVLLFRANGRMGKVYMLVIAIIICAKVLLLYLTFLREKYSYHCWIALLVVDMFLHIPCKDFSIWGSIVPVVFLILLVIYYRNRRDFFYKERIAEDGESRKRKMITELSLGMLIVVFMIVTLAYGIHKSYMEKPAKDMKYIALEAENTWTEEQAEAVASRWITAVEGKDTEEIQKIMEEISVERENVQRFLFLERTEFQTGIDQEKSGGMLSYIDAVEHGLAYYSLARISHYYDARTGRNHETGILVQEREDGLYTVLQHGKSEAEIAFIDMNEVVGEEGKEHFRILEFSEEEIVSLLSDIYTDEDVSFVKELAEAAGEAEYTQLFKKDPDKLSAYGQDALYVYAYGLMDYCIEYGYDSGLSIIEEDWEQWEHFINSILLTRSNRKGKYHCERYLKILEDRGKAHMDEAADQLRKYYDQKEMIISLLPDFGIDSQLNIFFTTLKFYLNDRKGISYGKTVQVKEVDDIDLLTNEIDYTLTIDRSRSIRISTLRYTGDDITMEVVFDGPIFENDPDGMDDIWYILYGDILLSSYDNYRCIAAGEHDADAILRAVWLEKEGLATLARVDDENSKKIADELMEVARKHEKDNKELPV